MKKIVIVGMMALVAIGAVSAQGFGRAQAPAMQAPAMQAQAPQELKTIEGKLELVQGHPAIVVKDKTYFVQIPQFLYGFVDGLKEGATVKLAGFEMAVQYAPNSYFFDVNTLTIGAKSYDLSQFGGMGGRGGMGGGMGNGMGGRGDMGGRGRW